MSAGSKRISFLASHFILYVICIVFFICISLSCRCNLSQPSIIRSLNIWLFSTKWYRHDMSYLVLASHFDRHFISAAATYLNHCYSRVFHFSFPLYFSILYFQSPPRDVVFTVMSAAATYLNHCYFRILQCIFQLSHSILSVC